MTISPGDGVGTTLFEIGEADFAVHQATTTKGALIPYWRRPATKVVAITDEAKQRGFIDNPRVAQSATNPR